MIESKFTLEGKAEGKAEDICTILNAKLIPFDANQKQQISRLNINQLDALIVATISFNGTSDLSSWLSKNLSAENSPNKDSEYEL